MAPKSLGVGQTSVLACTLLFARWNTQIEDVVKCTFVLCDNAIMWRKHAKNKKKGNEKEKLKEHLLVI